jgi:hypothetical protein
MASTVLFHHAKWACQNNIHGIYCVCVDCSCDLCDCGCSDKCEEGCVCDCHSHISAQKCDCGLTHDFPTAASKVCHNGCDHKSGYCRVVSLSSEAKKRCVQCDEDSCTTCEFDESTGQCPCVNCKVDETQHCECAVDDSFDPCVCCKCSQTECKKSMITCRLCYSVGCGGGSECRFYEGSADYNKMEPCSTCSDISCVCVKPVESSYVACPGKVYSSAFSCPSDCHCEQCQARCRCLNCYLLNSKGHHECHKCAAIFCNGLCVCDDCGKRDCDFCTIIRTSKKCNNDVCCKSYHGTHDCYCVQFDSFSESEESEGNEYNDVFQED